MKNHLWLASLVLTGTCFLRAADDIRVQPDFIIEGSSSAQSLFIDDLTSVILVTNTEPTTITLVRDYVVEEALVVGGGGAGGNCCGGGGGGGGVVYSDVNALAVAGTAFTLQVGAGGEPGDVAGNGSNTVLTLCEKQMVAFGGGGGGTVFYDGGELVSDRAVGKNGGSGGGGSGAGGAALQPGSSSGGYGAEGGGGFAYRFGGGGGGANNAGGSPSFQGEGGDGGKGFDCGITGENVAYGAGGGGGVVGDGKVGIGHDGAGNGGSRSSRDGGKGTDGLGAGGGGAGGNEISSLNVEGGTGGAGGSGAVALRLRRQIPEGAPSGALDAVRRDIFGQIVVGGRLTSLGSGASARVLLVVTKGDSLPVTNLVMTLSRLERFSFNAQSYYAFDEGESYSLRLVFDNGDGCAFDTAAFNCVFRSRTDVYYLAGEDRSGSSSFTGGDGAAGWTNAVKETLSTPSTGDYVLPMGSLLRTGVSEYAFPGNCLWSLGGEMRIEQSSLTIETAELVSNTLTVAVLSPTTVADIKGSSWALREASTLALNLAGGDPDCEVSFHPSLIGEGKIEIVLPESANGGALIGFYGDNTLATGDWLLSSLAGNTLTMYFSDPLAWPSSSITSEGPIAIDVGGSDSSLVIDRGSLMVHSNDLTLLSPEVGELVLEIPIECDGFTVDEGDRIVLAGDNSACSGIITFNVPHATLELRNVNAIGQAALNLNGATLSLDLTDFVGGLRLAHEPLSPFMLDLQGEASFDEDGRIVLFRLPMSESFDLSLIQGEPSISIPGFKGEYALGTTVQGDERIVYFFAGSDGNPVMEDSYRLKSVVTVVGYEGDDFESAPVLVRISPARIAGFDYSLVDKDHLAFTAADGSLCDYQIEKWDENGESLVWVRVPLLENGGRTTIDFWFDHDGPDCSSSPVTFGSDEFVDKRRMQDESDYTANGEAVPTRAPFAPTLAIASRFADGMGSLDVTLAVSGATERCMIMAALAKTLPANPGEPESWDEQLQVSAALSNGQESVSWHLGGGWGTDFKALRFFLLKNYRSVVYKELVGDGYAYVDLGRKGTGDDSYELQFRYPTATPPKSAMRIFGAREQDSQNSMDTTFFHDQNPKFVLDYWKGNEWRLTGMMPEKGMTYRAVLSPSLRELDWLNGDAWTVVAKNEKVVEDHGEFSSNLNLFNIGGPSISFADYCNFSGSLFSYSRRSVATGETREQLVPAKLLSSQRAGLVDLKSGRFFENAAETGGFKLNQMTEQVVVGPLAGAAPVASSANFLYRKPGFAIIGR